MVSLGPNTELMKLMRKLTHHVWWDFGRYWRMTVQTGEVEVWDGKRWHPAIVLHKMAA